MKRLLIKGCTMKAPWFSSDVWRIWVDSTTISTGQLGQSRDIYGSSKRHAGVPALLCAEPTPLSDGYYPIGVMFQIEKQVLPDSETKWSWDVMQRFPLFPRSWMMWWTCDYSGFDDHHGRSRRMRTKWSRRGRLIHSVTQYLQRRWLNGSATSRWLLMMRWWHLSGRTRCA